MHFHFSHTRFIFSFVVLVAVSVTKSTRIVTVAFIVDYIRVARWSLTVHIRLLYMFGAGKTTLM